MIWIPDFPAVIQFIIWCIGTLRLCHRQLERQLLQLIESICMLTASAQWMWQSRLIRGLKSEIVSKMASCWGSVSASGSMHGPNSQQNAARPFTLSWLLRSESSHYLWVFPFEIQIILLLYNLGLEWRWHYSSQHRPHTVCNNHSIPQKKAKTSTQDLFALTSSFRIQWSERTEVQPNNQLLISRCGWLETATLFMVTTQ